MALLLLLLGGVIAYALTRPEQVLVPTVIGESQTRRQAILEDAGFRGRCRRSFESCDEPRDRVRAGPGRGLQVDEGSTVDDHRSASGSARLWCRTCRGDAQEQARPGASRTEDLQVREDQRPRAR